MVEIPPKTTEQVAQEKEVERVQIDIDEARAKQFIYGKESGAIPSAVNQSSGACGLGQSLPCSKLENECPNWANDYPCQDAYFTRYAQKRYGSFAKAYDWWLSHKWW